jgi:hypothetical protein
MQVTSNGKPIQLKPSLEKELVSRKGKAVEEGVVLTADEAVRAAGGGLRLVYTTAVVVASVLVVAVIAGTAFYEPGDLVVFVPVVLVLGGALAFFMRFMYRRRMSQARRRTSEHAPRLPTPGTPIRVDAAGLTIAGATTPWPSLAIEAVEITQSSANDSSVAWIEWMTLTGPRGSILLDILLIKNGRLLIDAAWCALRPPR